MWEYTDAGTTSSGDGMHQIANVRQQERKKIQEMGSWSHLEALFKEALAGIPDALQSTSFVDSTQKLY
jgi:hypothetical protein